MILIRRILLLLIQLLIDLILLLFHSQNTDIAIIQLISNWPTYSVILIANTLTANQTPCPDFNLRGTKAYISDTFSSTKPNKLNNFLFQCYLYFCINPTQCNTDIVKINFAMTYLTGITKDWFEIDLNQED